MIKWIKSLIEKVFGKFCKCEEPVILEDEEKYLAEEKALADYSESFKEIMSPKKFNVTHTQDLKSLVLLVLRQSSNEKM